LNEGCFDTANTARKEDGKLGSEAMKTHAIEYQDGTTTLILLPGAAGPKRGAGRCFRHAAYDTQRAQPDGTSGRRADSRHCFAMTIEQNKNFV
jgi:hypothetical protein